MKAPGEITWRQRSLALICVPLAFVAGCSRLGDSGSARQTTETPIGNIGTSFMVLGSLRVSPDERRLAYAITNGGTELMVADGKRNKAYEHIGKKSETGFTPLVLFSPDSRHLAYAAYSDGKVTVVADGVPGKSYDDVRDLNFSPDSRTLAYTASSGNKWFVVIDGREGPPYDEYGRCKNSRSDSENQSF
jgi:hypothetical protein